MHCNGHLRSSRIFGVPSRMPNLAPARKACPPIHYAKKRRPCMSLNARRKPVAASDGDDDNEEGATITIS